MGAIVILQAVRDELSVESSLVVIQNRISQPLDWLNFQPVMTQLDTGEHEVILLV